MGSRLDERLTGAKIVGLLAGFAGRGGADGGRRRGSGRGDGAVPGRGPVLCDGRAVGAAVPGHGVVPLQAAFGQVLGGQALPLRRCGSFGTALGAAAAWPGPLLAVLGIAVLSTALAYLLYFRLLASAGATNLLLVTFRSR